MFSWLLDQQTYRLDLRNVRSIELPLCGFTEFIVILITKHNFLLDTCRKFPMDFLYPHHSAVGAKHCLEKVENVRALTCLGFLRRPGGPSEAFARMTGDRAGKIRLSEVGGICDHNQ